MYFQKIEEKKRRNTSVFFFHKKEAKVEFRRCLTSERDREKEEVRARDREKTRREKGKKGGGGEYQRVHYERDNLEKGRRVNLIFD